MPIGSPYNPATSFQISQLALNANQFEPTSPAKNSEPSIIVWDTSLNILQRVSTLTNIVLEELGGGLQIPRPEINIGKATAESGYGTAQPIFAHYLPPINSNFLNFNPKYYLFMQKSNTNRKKMINGNPVSFRRPAGIYHPTHLNGINFPVGSSFYSGLTAIPLNSEFDIALTPYTRTQIAINPFQWARYAPNSIDWAVPILADFGDIIENYKIQGKKKKDSRSALMFLCIGVENPDTTSNYPIIFGQLSIPFKLALKKEGLPSICVGLQFLMESSSVKTVTLPVA